MKIINYFLVGMISVLAISCVSPEEWGDKYENVVPEAVSNVTVKNVNGGAIISYTLPSPKDNLLGAKVVYSLTPEGEVMERYASAENDSIELEGYGDISERTVTVHTVHKNGKVSVGVPVTINPLTPPISVMRETLNVSATFGGIQVTWDNPMRKNMGLDLYVEDPATHEMVLHDKYFSNSVNGKTTFRPFNPEEQNFRIEMFDRWQNYAQPLETTLTPLEEVEIKSRDDRGNPLITLFDDGRVIPYDNSTPWRYTYRCDTHNNLDYAKTRPRVFELTLDWNKGSEWWHPGQTLTLEHYFPGGGERQLLFPIYFTVDMGRKAVYSRVEFLVRNSGEQYSQAMPVEFDIWGTNNPKTVEQVGDGSREANQAYWSSWAEVNGTDAWKNDWVKLGTFKYLLSSGDNKYFSGMTLSEEDIYQYLNGYEFDFNLDVSEGFRYLRWEIHETNTNNPWVVLHAIRYWGSYAD